MIAAAVAALATSAVAADTKVTASNGVVVNLFSDDFAARHEWSSPSVDFKEDGSAYRSYGSAVRIKKADKLDGLTIQGAVRYGGEWHRYTQAIFKGGDAAEVAVVDRKVMDCRRGCWFSEWFIIDVTPEQIAKYAENGNLSVQLSSEATTTAIITIPVSYLEAVSEVAK